MAIRAATRNESMAHQLPSLLIYKKVFDHDHSYFSSSKCRHRPDPDRRRGNRPGTDRHDQGRAACLKETVDTNAGSTEEDSPSSISEVAVRLGPSGAFVKAKPTGPVTPGHKAWTTWTTDPLTITGVVNDTPARSRRACPRGRPTRRPRGERNGDRDRGPHARLSSA